MAWRDADEALKEWRQALYRVGIFVFKDAFREESFSGFSLYDDAFPIIYVNNSAAKTRQIFTLFHELGHLLFHTSGIDPLDDQYVERLPERPRHIEVLCNRFAAQFLLPEKAFEAAFAGQRPTEQTAETLAGRFHVSREFIFRKFLDRNLITQEDYGRAARKWAAQKQKGKRRRSVLEQACLSRPRLCRSRIQSVPSEPHRRNAARRISRHEAEECRHA